MVKRSRIVAFFLIVILIGSLMGGTTKNILNNIKLGLDLQGGFEVLYDVKTKDGKKATKEVLNSTAEALDRRVNALGVNEPIIQIEGDNRVRVQLAGVKDQNQAREMLSTEANLSFRDVNDREMMNGSDLVEGGAKQTFDENGKPSVSLTLKSAEKFKEVTQEIVNMGAPNNLLVIWLDYEEGDSFKEESQKEDPKYLSAPQVSQVFNQDTVSIVGNFSLEEAKTLSSLLKAGALPVELTEEYSTSVGAKFGEDAMQKTITGGIIGILVIFLFMIAFYRFPGFIATITLSIYIYLILLVFDWMNGVLTLPGIAALILGVGMAVDANIITYERIKEELKVGKSVKSAFQAGNKNSLSTILDANITTILAAVVLFLYGTSSVKGFATMLILSILASFITAVYGSRLLLGLWVNSRIFTKKPTWFGVKKSEIKDIAENYDTLDLPTKYDRFDFVKHRRKFFIFSIAMAVAGIIALSVFRLNLGIDFVAGTRVEITAGQSVNKSEIQEELSKVGLETDDIIISGDDQNIGVARFTDPLGKDKIAELKTHMNDVYGQEPNVSTVSPTVGKELAKNAFKALLIASVGIIIYVTIRFEIYMALAAVIALLHDAFFIIALFSIIRFEVDITFIAAILTIVGYSINDTIVTFDRMRENMQKKKRLKTFDDIADVVNQSLRQTLGRSVSTVITVVIAVVGLLIFGSESIRSFSFALLIGLVAGTYSSLFIASQLWLVWKNKELKKKGVIKTEKVKRKASDEPQV
ncbi:MULTISPECIES: protein translocase subunit SecDF [Bacillaceae]|uniref:Multifunctional fusion protein n=1 Tax=Bacillus infantis NRRL B-14911 TaxID=1367477 RepID=U5LDV4_9BACI|nr:MULTISPECIES: protein translocase subunit SecDF [Bacillus]AGX05650.1 preprotein translocase subunit SecD [Bacillus infantis NRRL B-14911]EAR63639.1 preprotein translocase subunits D and F [Bacillus sp. NRRL B-14911]MCA1036362.1 protein translocase subunit SecDF [Bacillus infantis]MCP1159917.1 protein translocase subunit SecDF [Bacillus infantis]MDT0161956.1 protein translocase subunit SecDF [Bacillus sp. AG4(2022)]